MNDNITEVTSCGFYTLVRDAENRELGCTPIADFLFPFLSSRVLRV